MLEGVEHVGGDMFESVPNGDGILVKVGALHESLILCFWKEVQYTV